MKPITQQAHELLARHIHGSLAIDATAGNGHDTLFLARQVGPAGKVWAFDVQPEALRTTANRLVDAGIPVELRLQPDHLDPVNHDQGRVVLIESSHSEMAEHLPMAAKGQVSAIMFNLGYLPGSDKTCITASVSTLAALDAAMEVLAIAGILTVVVYPGHSGGREEADAVRGWFQARLAEGRVSLLTESEGIPGTGPQLLALRRSR